MTRKTNQQKQRQLRHTHTAVKFLFEMRCSFRRFCHARILCKNRTQKTVFEMKKIINFPVDCRRCIFVYKNDLNLGEFSALHFALFSVHVPWITAD